MKSPSFVRTSLALGALALMPVLPIRVFAAPRVAQPTVAPIEKAPVAKARKAGAAHEGYIQALRGRNGSVDAAQTLIRRFVPLHGNGPSISLVAAVHIGEKSYYQQIQRFLDKQDVVFYEGVKPSRSAAKTHSAHVAKPPVDAKPPIGIQKKMSDALQLQYQLDGIHYNRPQFRNSDLDWDTLSALATKAGPDTQQLLARLQNSVAGGPTITRGDQIVDRVLALSASTPLLATILRRLLIRALSDPDNLENEGAKSGSVAAKKLDLILVDERNKAVLADITALLKTSKRSSPHPVRSIAVFYGAAHMGDIERHLTADLGYRSAGEQWLCAIRAIHSPTSPISRQ